VEFDYVTRTGLLVERSLEGGDGWITSLPLDEKFTASRKR